jgi:hypothetical protein
MTEIESKVDLCTYPNYAVQEFFPMIAIAWPSKKIVF